MELTLNPYRLEAMTASSIVSWLVNDVSQQVGCEGYADMRRRPRGLGMGRPMSRAASSQRLMASCA